MLANTIQATISQALHATVSSTGAVVTIRNLEKRFGKIHAVRGVNLSVERGQIYGFLGPNGAGKTTTIRMLLGLIRPTSGQVQVFGQRLEGRTLDRDFPGKLSMIMADGSLLEQALVNILENAIAYSPDRTAIEVAAYEDRGNVVISIEDQGRGIPTSELERVFERFRRMEEATDRGKGAGLGLAISKGFVESMGGRIAAASPIHEGRGTRILISLPKEQTMPGHML